MIIIIGVMAKMYKHVGFCLDTYDKETCNDCCAQAKCLDMFQKGVEDDAEKANAQATADEIDADILKNVIGEAEAEKAEKDQAAFTDRVAKAAAILFSCDEKCYLCDDRAECVLKLMNKTHTHDTFRPDGSISQSAEKDQYIGVCSCIYKYDEECHDCFARLDCLAGYLRQGDENDTQAP
jgi:hypothetical protein